MTDSLSKNEISESAFEYLLAEILAITPPDSPDDEHVRIQIIQLSEMNSMA
jgi:hypothetical protein